MMSKKHYNKFTELFKNYRDKIPRSLIIDFANVLYNDNERFDYVRFYEAIDSQEP